MDIQPNSVETIDTLHFDGSSARPRRVEIVREAPLTIFLNGREFATLLFAGGFPEALTVGFLKSEGIIDGKEDIERIEVQEREGVVHVKARRDLSLRERLFMKRTISASCGRGTIHYNVLDAFQLKPMTSALRIPYSWIVRWMKEMNQGADLYARTRGTHNAGLAGHQGLLYIREDIGRHNAADMVIGESILQSIPLDDKVLLTTGRASSEIVIKGAKAAIPIVASRSAATSLAVRMAEKVGMTLVGYVRGGRLTVYCHPERISMNPE